MTVTVRGGTFSGINTTDTVTISDIGGGQGAVTDANVVKEGNQSASRRVDNETDGFTVSEGSGGSINLSVGTPRIGLWVGSIAWSLVSDLQVVIADGTNNNNRDFHIINSANYPSSGARFVPCWVDVSRTADTDNALNEAAISYVGAQITIGNVAGSLRTLYLDKITFTDSEGFKYALNGTTSIPQLLTTENTELTGNLEEEGGVTFFYGKIQIGEATTINTAVATTFTAEDETFVFVDQDTIGTNFLGWDVNLGATGSFSMTNCNFQASSVSGATNRPNLLFSGTTATATVTSCALLGLGSLDLTSSTTIDGGTVDSVSITQNGATVKNADLRPRSASGVAMITDGTFGATTGINNCNIINQGSGHAFEFTSTTYTADTEITFTNLVFDNSSFGSNTTANAAIRNTSGFEITVNLNGTSNTPSVTNVGAGSNVVFVASKLLTVNNIQPNTELRLYSYTDINDPNTYTELAGIERVGSVTSGDTGFTTPVLADGVYSTTLSYNTASGNIPVVIVAHALDFEFFREGFTLSASENTSFTVFQVTDRQYDAGSV